MFFSYLVGNNLGKTIVEKTDLRALHAKFHLTGEHFYEYKKRMFESLIAFDITAKHI
jgi:hypothetical protein